MQQVENFGAVCFFSIIFAVVFLVHWAVIDPTDDYFDRLQYKFYKLMFSQKFFAVRGFLENMMPLLAQANALVSLLS